MHPSVHEWQGSPSAMLVRCLCGRRGDQRGHCDVALHAVTCRQRSSCTDRMDGGRLTSALICRSRILRDHGKKYMPNSKINSNDVYV